MATKAHHHARRSRRRLRRIRKTVCGRWLLDQLARTLTTILLMIVAHWLHLPGPQ
jgi:hypothetical protein